MHAGTNRRASSLSCIVAQLLAPQPANQQPTPPNQPACLPGRQVGNGLPARRPPHLCPTTVCVQCCVSRSHTFTNSSLLQLTSLRPPRSTNTKSVTCAAAKQGDERS